MAQVKFLIGDLEDMRKIEKDDNEERMHEPDNELNTSNLKDVPKRVIIENRL